MKFKLSFGRVLLFVFIILLIFIARPVVFLLNQYYSDRKSEQIEKPGHTNDASHLNETKVEQIIDVPSDTSVALQQITALIQKALKENQKISIAGAQHSMGGHTIYPGGMVLDMKPFHYMQLDSVNNLLSVGSGALWKDIIPYLDGFGKSVAVMQSNNSFSVGGSISVNCHGWQPNAPPIASTVESFRLINAKGELLNCSRKENPELFSLVLGGYGLFGVILDVRLRVVDNQNYKAHQYVIKSKDYIQAFDQYVKERNDIGMVYGRININPDHFMDEAILSVFTIDTSQKPGSLGADKYASIRRTVFRASANSDYGKNLRWKMERLAASQVSGRMFSRNELLNEGVEVFQNSDAAYTDILHEYFIPKDSVLRFIEILKATIPAFKVDLLNITIRNVKRDEDVFLRYANEEVFGFVMLFNQERSEESEKEMKRLTQKLVDEAISLKGTYYLPYRLHATKEQLRRAYPQFDHFIRLKMKYDSTEVFNNKFYQEYK